MQQRRLSLPALALSALLPATLLAAPDVGDPAPEFGLPDTNYNTVYLSEQYGKVVQLFFWSRG